MEELIEKLSQVNIFSDFEDEQIEKILEISEVKDFKAQEEVFNEGDPSREILILLSGEFEVKNKAGTITVVSELGVVGEMGVLSKHSRSADVVCYTDAKALSIDGERLMELLELEPNIGLRLYKKVTHLLCENLRSSNIILEFIELSD